jgi:hypothetical protein
MRISIGGQPISAAGDQLSFPLPRISIVGNQLYRLGVRFKPWGYQQYSYDFIESFYADSDMGSENHIIMADTFRGDQAQGGNTVRLRLELWSFIQGSSYATLSVKTTAMNNLIFALDAARRNGIYILLCGMNTVRPANAPAWYDALGNEDRWDVQEYFWSNVAQAIHNSGHSNTILGYDLVNEPYIHPSPTEPWYGTGYIGSEDHFVCCIARGPGVDGTTARAWITKLSGAIKLNDPSAMITCGLLPYYTGPFGVSNTQDLFDFLSPHIYPPSVPFGNPFTLAQVQDTIYGFAAANIPNVVGETLPWGTPSENDIIFNQFIETMDGLISFSNGYGPREFTASPDIPKPPVPPDADPFFSYLLQTSFNSYRSAFLSY